MEEQSTQQPIQQPAKKQLPNPFLNAKRQWNFILGDTVAAKQLWQLVGLSSLLIAAIAVVGLIYIGSQSKFVPYLVEVNKLGQTIAVAPAQLASQSNELVTRSQLAQFIRNARTVTPDTTILRKQIYDVYALLNPQNSATLYISEWLNSPGQSLFEKASNGTVEVIINNVLKQSDQTWQIDWQEVSRSNDGAVLKNETMRAVLNIYHIPVTTEEMILRNPTGIIINTMQWQSQL